MLLLYSTESSLILQWGTASVVLIWAYTFWWAGGLIGAITMSAWYVWITGESAFNPIYIGYALLALVVGFIAQYTSRRTAIQHAVQLQLHRQAKQLSLLSDISLALQRTNDLRSLLHIILTAITAGYGLGFNRAMLFLVTDDEGTIKGEVGIGSMCEEDGYKIWEDIFHNNMDLHDFIRRQHEAEIKDVQLNDLLRQITIAPETESILHQALHDKRPYLIHDIDLNDPVQHRLRQIFRMQSFAVVPLINQNKQIGLILVDNNINHHPLSIEQVDAIVPLAAQASVAIENARLYDQTVKMSITDGLTGLYNQSYAQRTAELLVQEADAADRPLSAILMDLDNFKHYNDTNGHLEGNELLIQLSRILRETHLKTTIPCRFGGEEFVVLLPGVKAKDAAALAERIRSRVEEEPFRYRESQPGGRVTLSIGVAEYTRGWTWDELLKAADDALYEAKRNGKNRVVVRKAIPQAAGGVDG
ncbi:diguanylate cyclase [Marinicrinis lubricantis]|uniref:sensor domain-containing diguanylate cyclase n=1 Tax=Marinicrinis lubricantis TaxID=2086470 RepID=UPI0036D2795C